MNTTRTRNIALFSLFSALFFATSPIFCDAVPEVEPTPEMAAPAPDVHVGMDPAAPVAVSGKQAAAPPVLQVPVNSLDALIDSAKRQLDQISAILSALSAMINNDQVSTLKDKQETLKNIAELSATIEMLRYEKFAEGHTDRLSTYLLQRLNADVIQHLTNALRGTFTGLTPYKSSIMRKLPDQAAMSIPNMQKTAAENEQKIKALLKLADCAGLRWYNHAYRKVDRFVITPCRKHSIPQRSLIGLSLAGLSFYLWRLYNENHFRNHAPDFIWNLYGEQPIPGRRRHYAGVDAAGGHFEYDEDCFVNQDRLGPVGRVEALCRRHMGSVLVASGAFALLVAKCRGEWEQSIRPWIAKKLSILDSKLKGGACLKEAQKKQGIVEDVTFNDLVGLEHVKRDFSVLVNYLENPESYDRAGLTPPKGILLVGETRTGKTYSVKALFTEVKRMLKRNGRPEEFKFYNLGASYIQSYGIDYLVRLMKKEAPCIVFIDEIDLLTLQRGRGDQAQARLSEFLQCLSGALTPDDPKNQVIIIAATNKPENLDHALRQHGRFGKEIRFELPSLEERRIFIERKIRKLSLSPMLFDVPRLARETEGMSYEALHVLINNALLNARLLGRVITRTDIEETLDNELRHIAEVDGRNVPEHERQIMAAHLAGKAVALTKLDAHTKLAKVTIKPVMSRIVEQLSGVELIEKDRFKQKPRFEPGGVFVHNTNDTLAVQSSDEKRRLCKYLLAGDASEELLTGSCGYSCSQGMENALPIALSITCEGLDYLKLPKHAQKERFDRAIELLDECKRQVTELLAQHRDEVEAVAKALLEKETLSAAQIEEICANLHRKVAEDVLANEQASEQEAAAA